MGQKKQRLQRFLKSHPVCCFCGGATPATTHDHLPPRSIFLGRRWPEGYVFPVCEPCNAGSAERESIFAMITHFDPTAPDTPEFHAQSEKLIRAFKERHPRVLQEMILTANDVRRWVKKYEFPKPDGVAYGELPLVRMPPALVEAVRVVSTKLTLALHYKHAGKIAPADAELDIRWWTNAQRMAGKFPSEALAFVRKQPALTRGSVSLEDQPSPPT